MADYTWTWDAPTGTYKNHELSRKLYESAVANMKFMDHVTPIEGFGKRQGETVTLTRLTNIAEPEDPTLREGIRITEDEWSFNQTSITVKEIGRAVPYTSIADDLSFFDIYNPIQSKLRRQLMLTLDTLAAKAFKKGKVKYIPTGAQAATLDTDGDASTQATANYNYYHAERIRDLLYDTYHTPPMMGDDYIGIFRTKALRGIKDDDAFETWHKYTDPAAKMNGEVGRIENIRHIETNHAQALANVGSGNVLGEGIIFGEDSVAMAEVITPEMRMAMPQDFGRSKGVAWYGILEFGVIWDTANVDENRIIHITSS